MTRLCAMNLFLHGIGPDDDDQRAADPDRRRPARRAARCTSTWCSPIRPSARSRRSRSSTRRARPTSRSLTYNRPDFWTTTSNKQLNFVQHVKSLLKIHGRAAVVVPDNVLFEGGAGETVRRKLLHECDVHTLLRLPTGIFYAQGVKANVLFFDRKPGAKEPWTKKRLGLRPADQQALHAQDQAADAGRPRRVRRRATAPASGTSASRPGRRRTPKGRWRAYTYDEIVARDKVSLDLFWLRDESLEDSANLPDPHVLAQEIADDLRSALEQIEDILGDLQRTPGARTTE